MILRNSNYITDKIKAAVIGKKPLSLVRLGDGEYGIIKYPKFNSLSKCKLHIQRWFDSKNLSIKQIMSIRNQILRACQNADILGVPSEGERRKYAKWKNFSGVCSNYHIFNSNQDYFYFYDIVKLNYSQILSGVSEVTCITCRNVKEKMEKFFKIPVNRYLIRPEQFGISKHSALAWKGISHYPEAHASIYKWITTTDLTGKVFLIGAGGLGKAYCDWVKKSGGIGIDVGSLFDSWVKMNTRPYFKNVFKI